MQSEYSIKDLENLTGIKAHTLRIWEKRYNLLVPSRTDTNIRTYSIEELKKALNISLLYNEGLKISKIVSLSETEFISKVTEVIDNNRTENSEQLDPLLNSIMEMDSQSIESQLDELLAQVGMLDLYVKTIKPLLIRIGELWQLNTINISHEHLFSNILRKFIIAKIDNLPAEQIDESKVLIFLMEGENHELPILFYQYLLKEIGWNCVYLGLNLPLENLNMAYSQTKPDKVLTSLITTRENADFKKQLKRLLEIIPAKKLCLSGSAVIANIDSVPKEIRIITSMEDFKSIFAQ